VFLLGRGGGLLLVVSAFAYCYEDLTSNHAGCYMMFLFIVVRIDENKRKRGQGWSVFLNVFYNYPSDT